MPFTTLHSALKRLGSKEPTVENVFPLQKKSLLNDDQVAFLQDVICQRDTNNEGVTRREAVTLIAELGRCSCLKKAEYHLNYLIRIGRLKNLTRGGRVIAAQSTTSERSQISISQQYRWHCLIDFCWRDLHRKNANPPGLFTHLAPFFQVNLDETCFMCSEGTLKILGDSQRKKHNLNVADCRTSVTVLRVGSAAGVNGPVVFVPKGREVPRRFRGDRLHSVYGLPEGSCVIPNKNGYMDDDTWLKVVEILAPAIRKMKGIRDHPDWYCNLTYDGFKSHVNVTRALEIFAENKVDVVKEEGGASDTNQSYDQMQAVADKRATRQLLDFARKRITSFDQVSMIAVIAVAIKNLDASIWESSFRRVNLHPHYRISFQAWIDKIYDKVNTAGTKYTRTNEDSYYDAMPAVWKRMSIEIRQEVLQLIDKFEKDADENNAMWSKENCYKMLKYCSLKEIPKLRICHMVAREKDPGVIVGVKQLIAEDRNEDKEDDEEDDVIVEDGESDLVIVGGDGVEREVITVDEDVREAQENVTRQQQSNLQTFRLKPNDLIVDDFKTNKDAQEKLFQHMLNFAARKDWKQQEKGKRRVSSFLDIICTEEQERLLNPSVLDTIAGFIMEDTKGEGAKRRLPARRLNMIDGCISSWCSILNSTDRLELIKQANELSAVLGEIETDKAQDKDRRKKKAEEEEKDKKRRATEKKEKERQEREEGMRDLPPLIARLGVDDMSLFTVPQLCIICRFLFDDERGKQSKLNKQSLIDIAKSHYEQWVKQQHGIMIPQVDDTIESTIDY